MQRAELRFRPAGKLAGAQSGRSAGTRVSCEKRRAVAGRSRKTASIAGGLQTCAQQPPKVRSSTQAQLLDFETEERRNFGTRLPSKPPKEIWLRDHFKIRHGLTSNDELANYVCPNSMCLLANYVCPNSTAFWQTLEDSSSEGRKEYRILGVAWLAP